MEIGGFITEGAEIVNHDASLSGNGTVDSPLGLSNETVLWSGEQNVIGSTTATLNLLESATNFEKLIVYVVGSAQVGAITAIDIVIVSDTNAYYTLSVSYSNNTANTLFVDCCILQINGTSFNVSKGFRKSITTGVSNDTSRGPTIVKVIGVNRKQ